MYQVIAGCSCRCVEQASEMIEQDQGAVAQLGERLLCTQEVIGSIPFSSTTSMGL